VESQVETVLDESYDAKVLSQEITATKELIKIDLVVITPSLDENELETLLNASIDRDLQLNITEVSTQ